MSSRRLVRRATAAAAVALLLTGCSAGTEATSAPRASTSATPEPTAPGTAGPTTASPRAVPTGRVIEVRYAGGQVTGVEQRVSVPLGEQVVLRVVSDVTEQIHVHGYDVYVDLRPGMPVEATFAADKPGSWEVELHDAGRPLFSLRVA